MTATRQNCSMLQKPSAMKHIKAAVRDHNTLLLLIQYGCCFGVELTMSNVAAFYFYEYHGMTPLLSSVFGAPHVARRGPTHIMTTSPFIAPVRAASIFGLVNIVARSLGGARTPASIQILRAERPFGISGKFAAASSQPAAGGEARVEERGRRGL